MSSHFVISRAHWQKGVDFPTHTASAAGGGASPATSARAILAWVSSAAGAQLARQWCGREGLVPVRWQGLAAEVPRPVPPTAQDGGG